MYRPDETDISKKKSESLSNYVYEAIKKKIINGELAPGSRRGDGSQPHPHTRRAEAPLSGGLGVVART